MGSTNVTAVYIPQDIPNYIDRTTAIATAQATDEAENLTLDGDAVVDGVAVFPRAVKVSITAAGDVSEVNFTFTGTDFYGNSIVETIAGPTAEQETTTTTNYFLTVSEIAVGASTEGVNVSSGPSESFAVTVFSGASRIKGLYAVFNEAGKTLEFRKGTPEGEVALAMTTSSTNVTQDIMLPEMGIRYETGCVLTYNGDAIKGLTVFHA